MVCAVCDSDAVVCDAFATWDVETQTHVIQNTFEKGGYCETCDRETKVKYEALS
jgi:hypothetical protein